jgi:hypothetical protein
VVVLAWLAVPQRSSGLYPFERGATLAVSRTDFKPISKYIDIGLRTEGADYSIDRRVEFNWPVGGIFTSGAGK